MYHILLIFITSLASMISISQNQRAQVKTNNPAQFIMPEESEPHEGTWLQWPHRHQYGDEHETRLQDTWVAMTKALATSENVHLIVYSEAQQERVEDLLMENEVNMDKVDFSIYETDDVWVRDNGPIYVKDNNGKLVIQDWGFNGWGNKVQYNHCNEIPHKVAQAQGKEVINLNDIMINEGGSVELDGHGTLMACKSSILNENRNPGMTQAQAELIFTKYLGITNFVWLDGQAGLEITDQHIDGFARFGNKNTIVTMNEDDLAEFQVLASDIKKLFKAKNINGDPYNFVKVPLTKEDVITDYGKNLGYKGSYCNYYIANTVVLVPNYDDENDQIANSIIQKLYPTRKVIGIDCRNLYANGGMIHCVTQQQPK